MIQMISWKRCWVAILGLISISCGYAEDPIRLDANSDATLTVPALSSGAPSAGKRVAITPPEYDGTSVFHTIYLPEDWKPDGEPLPIIFEYTGNYFPGSGSTGRCEDAALGYCLSGGKYIWVSLPYVSEDHRENEITWWGDVDATVEYAKQNVPRILREFNADDDLVFLCGFSRGAIGVNFIGLHDDEIAGLWDAFISHDHFDGVRQWRNTSWGTPLERYRSAARLRLNRVQSRPYLVSQNGTRYGTETYLRSVLSDINHFSFNVIDAQKIFGEFPNAIAKTGHTDRWALLPSPDRTRAWMWMNQTVATLKLDSLYSREIQSLVENYCIDCHGKDLAEAEIDLNQFRSLEDARQHTDVWMKVRRIVESGQMPPKDAEQPTRSERVKLESWTRAFLGEEARKRAGDPGPVLLRRLNNEEYNFSVRDLTGIQTLNPTEEFPVDGAAGEGFINTGTAQAMSASLVTKYLDAAKQVANHMVLLPDGIRFSEATSRRDQTDELLRKIRTFYRQFTRDGVRAQVVHRATDFDTSQGGVVPLEEYLAATLIQRDALADGKTTIAQVAEQHSLSPKYLALLWDALTQPDTSTASPLLENLRQQWQQSTVEDAPRLAAAIELAEQRLWKFNPIGQLSEGGKQKIWMEAVNPIAPRHEFRIALNPVPSETTSTVHISALDARSHADSVVWERPRIEFQPGEEGGVAHPPILLKDVAPMGIRVEQLRSRLIPQTSEYLAALATAHRSGASLERIAERQKLDPNWLQSWARASGLSSLEDRDVQGHMPTRLTKIQGYDDINGWGTEATPSMLTNRSQNDIAFLTLVVPARSVVTHPSPSHDAVVIWKSPIDGEVSLSGLVADADRQCGNGAQWSLRHISKLRSTTLATGRFENGGENLIEVADRITVGKGDLIRLSIDAIDRNHSCDTTHVSLRMAQAGDDGHVWDLASDVVDRIHIANPLSDLFGNEDVWHFCAIEAKKETKQTLIEDSALEKWRSALLADHDPQAVASLATAVEHLLGRIDESSLAEPDRQLRRQLLDWIGPLRWAAASSRMANDLADDPDASSPTFGQGTDPDSFVLDPLESVSLVIPGSLTRGATLVTAARIHPASKGDGIVQVDVSTDASQSPSLSSPILASNSPTAIDGESPNERLQAAYDRFRNLFPAALCYSRIVPVDEVVTLALYYRDDDRLKDLMLDEQQAAELDRLWDELLYVAREPHALDVAMEQIYEFATQDRPDLVEVFGPMRKLIGQRADRFDERLEATEPIHVDAIIDLADRAWRRPLVPSERQSLEDFYRGLRNSGIDHEESARLLFARMLTSPSFLFRNETPASGDQPGFVSTTEMATRLSYFLWSSLPDEALRRAAASGELANADELLAQTKRMLADRRVRRLATQFACQWLHVRDFDQNDDKNERLYPEFSELRQAMYEETVRFFEDMFRNNGSILDVVDADHTFLNEALAKHYGIAGVQGPQWRRVDGVRQQGRGGILTMATFLSSQSGASRTSPILRGNWVYETLLGQRLPRPPADVPQLPETVPAGLTARQLIEMHSSAPACAVCHAKIDPYGFALEQYDTIGRLRTQKVDTQTTLPDDTKIQGVDELRKHLNRQRKSEWVRQFCRKLLGYALGREVLLSDELLLDTMQQQLEANDYRFHSAVEVIVTSDPFRKIRAESSDQP